MASLTRQAEDPHTAGPVTVSGDIFDKLRLGQTYRVQGIPKGVDQHKLVRVLSKHLLGHDIKVFSLAQGLPQGGLPSSQDATVAFRGPKGDKIEDVFMPTAELRKVDTGNKWMLPAHAMGLEQDLSFDLDFFGFTVLHDPGRQQCVTDYIAITGLGGRALASWMPKGDREFMWLRDHLPRIFRGVRTITYGYNTKVVDSQSEQLVQDLGRSLAQSLQRFDCYRFLTTKLVFIAHSLGGIVLKHAITHMMEDPRAYDHIFSAMDRIMLFGVTHKGMRIEHLLTMVGDRCQPNEKLVRQLNLMPFLESIDKQFGQICEARLIRIISIIENERTHVTAKVDGKWVRGAGEAFLLVPEDSAAHRLSSSGDHLSINRDHSEIAKLPYGSEDLKRVCELLKPSKIKFEDFPGDSKYFCGRQRELGQIREYFEEASPQDRVTYVVLYGISGIGKTLLAKEYEKQSRDKYGGRVMVISSESEERFVTSAAMEAPELGIDLQAYDYQDVSKSLAKHLNDSSHGGYLVILDDIFSLRIGARPWQQVEHFLNQLKKGHILSTSPRSEGLFEFPWHRIEIKLMNPEDSRLLFEHGRNRTHLVGSDEIAVTKEFVDSLHGYPMAIHRLANFYRATETQPNEYKSRFEIARKDSQTTHTTLTATATKEYMDVVFHATWYMHFKEISAKSPTTVDMLKFWVCVHPKDFGFELFENFYLVQPTSDASTKDSSQLSFFTQSLEILVELCLCDRNKKTGYYTMHDMPFAWFRHRLKDVDGGMGWAAAASIGLAVTDKHCDNTYWTRCQHLLPHAIECWDLKAEPRNQPPVRSNITEQVILDEVGGLTNLGDLFRTQCRKKEALQVLLCAQKLIKKHHVASGDSSLPYQLYNDLGNLYKDLSKHDKALDLFNKAYKGYSSLQDRGPSFRDARLGVLSNLASQYEKVGRVEEATKRYDEILAGFEGMSDNNQERISCLERYAALQFKQTYNKKLTKEQKYCFLQEARQKYELVYEKYVDAYKDQADAFRVGRAAYNLANVYAALGDTASLKIFYLRISDALYRQALPIVQKQNPYSTLLYQIRLEHGDLCTRLFRYKTAERLLTEAIDGFQRIEMSESLSRRVLNAREALANLYWARGMYSDAEREYEKVARSNTRKHEAWFPKKMGQKRKGFLNRLIDLCVLRVMWLASCLLHPRAVTQTLRGT